MVARPNLVRVYDPDFRELTEGEETILHSHPVDVPAPVRQVFLHTPAAGAAAGLTQYLSFPFSTWSASESDCQMYLPYGGHLVGLVVSNGAVPATDAPVVTVRINGASTPISVTIPVESVLKSIHSDAAHSVPFQSGKLLSVQVVNNDSETWVPLYVMVTVVWD